MYIATCNTALDAGRCLRPLRLILLIVLSHPPVLLNLIVLLDSR